MKKTISLISITLLFAMSCQIKKTYQCTSLTTTIYDGSPLIDTFKTSFVFKGTKDELYKLTTPITRRWSGASEITTTMCK